MPRIRPVDSANGMNPAGSTSPRSGCCQRTRASTSTIAIDREVEHRLVVDDQLVGVDGAAQLRFHL